MSRFSTRSIEAGDCQRRQDRYRRIRYQHVVSSIWVSPRMQRMADPGNSGRPEMAGGTLVSRFGSENQSTSDGHGANDSVKRREAEQIVVALRDNGFPAEYSLAPDQGNGF